MKLGYTKDHNGNEVSGTTIIPAHIRALDVALFVHRNRDISYPLQSPHNKGFHVDIQQQGGESITEFNVNGVSNESELIDAVNQHFDNPDTFVMITSALSGDTFAYETSVFDQTAIDNHSYDCWDEDKEELEDNAERVVPVFLNDQLRWQVH